MDDRRKLSVNEGVWFPNKEPDSQSGYTLWDGMVTETHKKYHVVILKQYISFQSQSGSPVISRLTGKVIETLSRADYTKDKKPIMYLTPSYAIQEVFNGNNAFSKLSEAIGKR